MRFITALFIFVIVFAVASTPSALSQTFTTVTNIMTTTGLFTSTAYSTNTVGTTTQTVVSSNTFVSTTDTNAPAGGMHLCYYDWWNITIDPGTLAVTGTIGPPSSKIDFFIMNQNQYYYFNHGPCSGIYSAEVAVYGLTSTYSLDWMNPPTGWYYFIFFNEKSGIGTGTITTPFVLVATFNEEQTSTAYNVVTNQVALTATGTVTSLQVTQVPAGLGSTMSLPLIGGTIVVVVVIIAALYFVRSRAKVRKSRTTSAPPDRQFCLNCGKALPLGSKFCNKCGTAQE